MSLVVRDVIFCDPEDPDYPVRTLNSHDVKEIFVRLDTLEDQYDELKQRYEELKTHLEYMPGGDGYLAAKAEFETARAMVQGRTVADDGESGFGKGGGETEVRNNPILFK
jgi:hypothetical protein